MKNLLALSRHAARLSVGYVISFSFVMGAALILVACGGGGSAPTAPVTLSSIAITPAPVFIGKNTTLNLAATGTYSNGTTADLTSRVTWTSADLTIASVGPSTGVATGVALGTTAITATMSGITSPAVTVTVTVGGSTSFGRLNIASYEHTATLLLNGNVLVAGGFGTTGPLTTGPLNSAELFDPATNIWTLTGNLGTARNDHTATLITSGSATGKVLLLGGLDNNAADLNSAELYDPGTKIWTLLRGILQKARSYHTATLLNTGKVLVVGGAGSTNINELFDPNNPAASAVAAAPDTSLTGRYSHTATLLANSSVLVAGGFDGTNALNTAELYNSAGSGVLPTDTLATGRYLHSATLLQDGRVLVVGGIDPMSHELASAELYDPNAVGRKWTSAGSLSTARFGHTATLMPNGQVLVMGGSNATNPNLSSAELYTPGTGAGTWTATGNLQTGRHVYSATLLPYLPLSPTTSDKVLVVGGIGDAGTLSSVELHN